jgi:hypothetical protein
MDEVSRIVTPKKKDQSGDTKLPSEICKFSQIPLRKIAEIKWNGP